MDPQSSPSGEPPVFGLWVAGAGVGTLLGSGMAVAWCHSLVLALQHWRIFSARFGAGWAGYPQPGF